MRILLSVLSAVLLYGQAIFAIEPSSDFAFENPARESLLENTRSDTGILRLLTFPSEVSVYINGKHIGATDGINGGLLEAYLPEGKHSLVLRKRSLNHYAQEFIIHRNTTTSIDVKLHKVSFVNSVGMNFNGIPSGEFMLGSPRGEAGRSSFEDQVKVTLTSPFWMGSTEVSQVQWQKIMGTNIYQQADKKPELPNPSLVGKNKPMVYVSWLDAMEFCARLTKREHQNGNLPDDLEYRLPTEAEWEFACRAGSSLAFSIEYPRENGKLVLGLRFANFRQAWLKKPWTSLLQVGWNNMSDIRARALRSHSKPLAVGSLMRNKWGLYDMHGNVAEWCADWFTPEQAGGYDPFVSRPVNFYMRSHRGGAWFNEANQCRSSARDGASPGQGYYFIGFRVALTRR